MRLDIMKHKAFAFNIHHVIRLVITILYCTFFLLLISTYAYTQERLYFGKIIADTGFSCNDLYIQREGITPNGHSAGLKTICQSENELEIRLFVVHRPSLTWDLIVLTYNKGAWSLLKYWDNFGRTNYDTAHPVQMFSVKPKQGFDSLFSSLKMNQVFTLPDQDLLTKDYLVDDGNIYFLSFKAGNKMRRYYFENPEEYKEHFEKIKEFQFYDNIASIFYEAIKNR